MCSSLLKINKLKKLKISLFQTWMISHTPGGCAHNNSTAVTRRKWWLLNQKALHFFLCTFNLFSIFFCLHKHAEVDILIAELAVPVWPISPLGVRLPSCVRNGNVFKRLLICHTRRAAQHPLDVLASPVLSKERAIYLVCQAKSGSHLYYNLCLT